MNDQRFFDLAMKVIARQATGAERADLDALLAREPELRAEFTRLEADARAAKDALPLVAACTSSTGQFPAYARERLQTTVRQMLGPNLPNRGTAWGWRWGLWSLATAAAVLLLAAVLAGLFDERRHVTARSGHPDVASRTFDSGNAALPAQSANQYAASVASRTSDSDEATLWAQRVAAALPSDSGKATLPPTATSNAPVIQLAMLDTAGWTRGTDMNETATPQGTSKESPVQHFSSSSELEAWEKNWPNGDGRPAAKIIYDPAAGEVRVSGRSRGKFFQRTFPLEKEYPALTWQHVMEFVREQTKM